MANCGSLNSASILFFLVDNIALDNAPLYRIWANTSKGNFSLSSSQFIFDILHVFENNDVDLFVHNYTRGDRGQQNASPPERIHDLNSGLYQILECSKTSTNLDAKYPVNHGHCSVKRDVLKAIKYQDWNYAEDGDFCQRVLKSGHKVLGTSHKLLYYCRKN